HGAYLCINHAWSRFGPSAPPRIAPLAKFASLVLTFISIVVAWVFFRADSLTQAKFILSKMADPTHAAFGRGEIANFGFLVVFAAIAWFAPNTQEIMGYDHDKRRVGETLGFGRLRPLLIYATAAVLAFGILGISQHSEFIYFRF
ncbi:MAG TPA: MBOAT family protein, partial [Bradyrhizobium sp.]|nr:MBOAT family protein [Bradyrhizobium sp.]